MKILTKNNYFINIIFEIIFYRATGSKFCIRVVYNVTW